MDFNENNEKMRNIIYKQQKKKEHKTQWLMSVKFLEIVIYNCVAWVEIYQQWKLKVQKVSNEKNNKELNRKQIQKKGKQTAF